MKKCSVCGFSIDSCVCGTWEPEEAFERACLEELDDVLCEDEYIHGT